MTADFASPIVVKQEYEQVVIADLTSFTNSSPSAPGESVVTLDVAGNVLELRRDLATGQLTAQGIPDPTKWLLEKLAVEQLPANLSVVNRVGIEQINAKLQSLSSASSTGVGSNDIDALVAELTELGGETFAQYREIDLKITEIETKLNAQREADEIQLSLAGKEEEVKAKDILISEVQGLIDRRQKLSESLARFTGMLSPELEAESSRLRNQVMTARNQNLAETAVEQDLPKPVSVDSEVEAAKPRVAMFLLPVALGFVAMGILGMLLTSNVWLLVLSTVFALLELGMFFLINNVPQAVSKVWAGFNKSVEAKSEKKQSNAENSQVDKFFIDKAWVNALKFEEQELDKLIQTRLDGQDYKQILIEKEAMQRELEEAKAKIAGRRDEEISPEDYLKLRRELDMLKIDKARTESELRAKENYAEISEKMMQLDDLEFGESSDQAEDATWIVPADSLIKEIIPTVESIKLEGKAWHWQIAGADNRMSEEDMFSFYVLVQLEAWSKAPVLPFVIVNPAVGLEKLLNAKLSRINQIGQLVIVQTQ